MKVRPGTESPKMDGSTLIIHTTEKFEKGIANRDVVRQIAHFYGVRMSDVRIKSGLSSRRKTVEITGTDEDFL